VILLYVRRIDLMKKLNTKLIALLFALSLLSACGGGGGGGSTSGGGSDSDTMTVNIVSLSTPTTTTTYTGSMSTTPTLIGMVYGTSQTVVELAGPTLQVAVCAGGSNASTYPMGLCAAGSGTVTYIISAGTTTTYNGATGTVTLTSVGGVGQPITGSFDAIVSDTTNTMRVWGSFSVTNAF
jgi:hypothetical protein